MKNTSPKSGITHTVQFNVPPISSVCQSCVVKELSKMKNDRTQ